MANKVRVMHIITGLHVGGAEMMLYRLLQYTRHQQPVVVSLRSGGKVADMISQLNIPVYSLGLSRNLFSLYKLGDLTKLINQYKPDVVQSWLYAADLLGGYVAKRDKLPVIWNIRQSEVAWIKGQWHIAANQRVNAFLSKKLPNSIVYCAHTVQQKHEAIGYKNRKSIVIANGINTDKFSPDSAARQQVRKQWAVDNNTKVIGIVGRYDALKNQHRFLRVFSQLIETTNKPLQAIMVGRGIDENNSSLMKDIRRLGLQKHCQLLGEHSNIPAIMNGFDIHLLTSNSEGWPNVLAEAMSCGLPCVSTDVSDVAQILGSNEYIAAVDDENGLLNACNKLLAMNNQQLRQVGKRCRQQIIEHFSLAKTIADYDKLYQSYLPQ